MPKKVIDSRTTNYKKKAYKKKKYTKMNLSKASLRALGNKLEKVMGEKKYVLRVDGPQSILSAGQVIPIADPPQGTPDTSRIGDQIYLTSMEVRLYMNMNNSVGSTLLNRIRIIIFQFFPALDAASVPSVGQILLTAGDYRAPYNHDQRFDFHILHDKTYHLTQQAVGVFNDNSLVEDKFFITKFRKHQVQYVNGTIAGSNRLFMLYISDKAAAPAPLAEWYIKTNYRDN